MFKLERSKWKTFEGEWVSFEETETYENYITKNFTKHKLNEMDGIQMDVHDQLSRSHGKTLNIVSFLTKSTLGKFSRKNKWKLEVWLKQKGSGRNSSVSCDVVLMRPMKKTVYSKKLAGSLNEAVKSSLCAIENSLHGEKKILNQGVY